MGRYYKTTDSAPVDFMYKDDTPLMYNALQANDQYIDQDLAQSGKINAFTIDHTPQDADAANQLASAYHNQANDISTAISRDPANWRKQQGGLRDLTNQLQTDYQTGDISKYMSNAGARKANFDSIDAQVAAYNKSGGTNKDGNAVGVDPITAMAAKNYADSQFKGTKNPDGSFNSYQGIPLMDNMDVAGKLGDIVSKMKDEGYNISKQDLISGGRYFNKVTDGSTGVTQDRILQVLNDRIQGDPQLANYLKQRQQIGIINGVKTDANGNLASPFSTSLVPLTDQETKGIAASKANINTMKDPNVRKQLLAALDDNINQRLAQRQINWDYGNYLTPIMQGVMEQYAHSTTTHSNELSNNSSWNDVYNQGMENFRQGRQLGQSASQFATTDARTKQEFADKMAWDKYQFAHKDDGTGKGGSGGSGGGTVDNVPVTTGVTHQAFNQLNGLRINSQFTPGKDVPLFSNEGLNSSIVANKKTVDDLTNKISAATRELNNTAGATDLPSINRHLIAQNQIRDLNQSLQDANNKLYTSRQQYGQTENAVLSNNPQAGTPLSQSDRDVYKEFQQNGDPDGKKFQQYIANLRKSNPNVAIQPNGQVNPTRVLKEAGQSFERVWDRTFRTHHASDENYGSESSPVVKAAEDKLQSYMDARKRVAANKDAYLRNVSQEVIKSDGINPNLEDGDSVKKIFLDNPTGSVLLDANGQDLTKSGFSTGSTRWSKQINNNFESGDGGNSLGDYIRDNNVGMTISNIGATSTAGRGTGTMKVFFNDPKGNLPSGVPFYIAMSHDLQNSVGNYFGKSDNPDVARVSNDLTNADGSSIREKIHSIPNGSDTRMTINMNGSDVPIYVHKIENGHLIVHMIDNNGKVVPFPKIPDAKGKINGAPSDFNNTDEFVHTKQAIEQSRNK